MTPRDKAARLISRMRANLYSDGLYDAKQCAIVAIILLEHETIGERRKYWNEVRKEIDLIDLNTL